MRQVCAVLKEPKLTQIQAAIVIIGLPRVNLLVETALGLPPCLRLGRKRSEGCSDTLGWEHRMSTHSRPALP